MVVVETGDQLVAARPEFMRVCGRSRDGVFGNVSRPLAADIAHGRAHEAVVDGIEVGHRIGEDPIANRGDRRVEFEPSGRLLSGIGQLKPGAGEQEGLEIFYALVEQGEVEAQTRELTLDADFVDLGIFRASEARSRGEVWHQFAGVADRR